METFSALLAICAGNSPVAGKFPAQRPVMRSFDVLFYLRLNKCLSKQSWGWWFETPSRPLWRHCNANFPCSQGRNFHKNNIPLKAFQWTVTIMDRSIFSATHTLTQHIPNTPLVMGQFSSFFRYVTMYSFDVSQPNNTIEFHFNLSRVTNLPFKRCSDIPSHPNYDHLYEFDVYYTRDNINTTAVNWTRIPYVSSYFWPLWWRHQMSTFPRYWPFVREIHRSPLDSPHKSQ